MPMLRTSYSTRKDTGRKLIIFTEHRDTLHYLTERIQTVIGRAEAVVTIHGSMRREDRQKSTGKLYT